MSCVENEKFGNDVSKTVVILVHLYNNETRSEQCTEADEELEENHDEEREFGSQLHQNKEIFISCTTALF